MKGYCTILAAKSSRAQDYIHWHGFWAGSPRGGGRFPFPWDDAMLTVVHNQLWRQRQMVSADLLLWETDLGEAGSNVSVRTSSPRAAKWTRLKHSLAAACKPLPTPEVCKGMNSRQDIHCSRYTLPVSGSHLPVFSFSQCLHGGVWHLILHVLFVQQKKQHVSIGFEVTGRFGMLQGCLYSTRLLQRGVREGRFSLKIHTERVWKRVEESGKLL